MNLLKCDDIVTRLNEAPVDPRTGNKVVYGMSWIADRKSMIGVRNEDWVERELKWFYRGSNSLKDLEPPVPKAFQQCANSEGEVNSAYGHILFNPEVLDGQDSIYNRVIGSFLNEGLETRHATAIISDRNIHQIATEDGKKDFICTNALSVMVDDDFKVNIFAQMRSMDAVWGYRADYSMWEFLMGLIVRDLNLAGKLVTYGNIVFQVANLHVYPRHFEMLYEEAESIYEANERLIWKDSTTVI